MMGEIPGPSSMSRLRLPQALTVRLTSTFSRRTGVTFAGRVAASLLHAVGLPELVTENLADYEALALKLATDRPLLKSVVGKLERNRLTHPLFDTARFARHIESAYESMVERWQRGDPPASFSVEPIDR